MAKGTMQRIGIVGFAVTAFLFAGISPATAEEGLTPSAPLDPTVTASAVFRLRIEWQPPASEGASLVSTYTVYRSYDGVTFTPIAVVASGQLAVEDGSADVSARVIYYVTATNEHGEGAMSVTATYAGVSNCSPATFTLNGGLEIHKKCVTGTLITYQT